MTTLLIDLRYGVDNRQSMRSIFQRVTKEKYRTRGGCHYYFPDHLNPEDYKITKYYHGGTGQPRKCDLPHDFFISLRYVEYMGAPFMEDRLIKVEGYRKEGDKEQYVWLIMEKERT